MDKALIIDSDYAKLISSLKNSVKTAQLKADLSCQHGTDKALLDHWQRAPGTAESRGLGV